MAIAAKISSSEIYAQVASRFTDSYFEARLINAPGTVYDPGITVDSSFLSFEVPAGQGGYTRQVIGYGISDISNYADDGVGLSSKATIFTQNGTEEDIEFTHAALVWSSGNTTGLSAVGTAPSAAVDGTYTNIPIDTTDGDGVGLTVDLTITNSGASSGDYALSIVNSGYDYSAADVLVISEGTLLGLGAVTAGAGNLAFGVDTAYSPANAGDLLAVAQTSSAATIAAGNEAIFYWNLKQFGYYSV